MLGLVYLVGGGYLSVPLVSRIFSVNVTRWCPGEGLEGPGWSPGFWVILLYRDLVK